MGLAKTHDQIDFLHWHLFQALGLLTAHTNAQLLHRLHHVSWNDPWLDAGAEDPGTGRRQVLGAGFGDLAQAGVVFAKKKYVSLEYFSTHKDLQ
jgi:hypothetical protein